MSKPIEVLQRLRQFWQKWFGQNTTNSIPLDACILEDRVLYSATMMPMEWVDAQEGFDGQIDQIDDLVASELQNDGSIDLPIFPESRDLFVALDSALLTIGADSVSEEESQVEIVFVDSSVVDYQLIVDDLRQQCCDGTRLEVSIIDSDADGLSQVSQWLSNCESSIDTFHVITQGTEDSFRLGSTWLDTETVVQHENELRSWKNYFSDGVELKIYGCDLASTGLGKQLIGCISEWTGLRNDITPLTEPLVVTNGTNAPVLDEPAHLHELEFDSGSLHSILPSSRHEVIFIDRQLPDLQQMLAELESTRSDNTIYEFVWLNQEQDGITLVSNFLSQSNYDFDAVHIVSHGNTAGFQLGSVWFSNSTLVDRIGELQHWQSGLSQDADLLIYGCSVAMTDSGQTWLNELSSQLQVDVAASTNLTGHQSLGGDWILEYSVGALESSLLPAGQTSLNWYGTLAFATVDDTASTPNNVPITVNIATNDSGSPTILDISNPSSGTATYSGSSITYTPTAGYTGSTSINYLATDGTEGLTNYWKLDGTGTDSIGSNNGTLTNGPTTTTGRFGSALSFDEVDDYVLISDLAYGTNFSISFAFRISDNSGTLFQYLYSHGTVATQNSVNVYLGESGSGFVNTLRTIALDGNDATTGIEIDVNLGTLGVLDGNWHTYTLTVSSTSGATVYIDGVSRASNSTVATDGINPTGSIYLGARSDLNVDRFYGGSLDSVAIYSQELSAADVAAREVSGSAVGTLNLMIGGAAPMNTVPTSQNINEDATRIFSSGNGNQILIADSDAGGANNEVTISVTSGTLTLAGTSGLTFVAGDGTSDASMTIRGTATAINTALNGLTYNSALNFNGVATLTVATEDSSLLSLNLDASMPGLYEFTSNANDTGAGAAQNGTLNGNAAIVTDATRGQVLSLDGSGDYVRIAGTYSNPTEVTIGGWVNLLSAAGRSEFISLSDRVHIALDDSGSGVKGSIQTGASTWVDFASGRSIAGTGWHHVMFVYSDSGNLATLYIDGVSVVSTAIASSIYWTGATDTLIGVHPTLPTYANALMDDVRIYSRALSASDVAVLASDLSRYDTDSVIVNIAAVNDTPTAVFDTATAVEAGGVSNGTAGTNPTGNVLTNDTDIDSGDTKIVTGVAAGTVGSASGSVAASVTGTYGSINIASNGTYTYSVNNSNATVQALRTSAQTITDVFTYTMTDSGGLTSTTQITVTIQGANDTPTAVLDTATAVEAGGIANGTAGTNPTGNVLTNDTDVDSGDSKTVTGVAAGTLGSASGSVASPVTGSFGSINIAANGSYTYTVDNSNATVQALRTSGQTITDVFTYTMRDTAGLTSTSQITVTIQGANDAPAAVFDTATAVEAGGVSNGTAGTNPTGNVLTNDTDVDSAGNGETKTVIGVLAGTQVSASGNVASSVAGGYGSITIAANGAYTYTVDNSNVTVQALRTGGQTITDIFTYTMIDTAGSTSTTQITVTIQGANDAPSDVVAATYLSTLTPIASANTYSGVLNDLDHTTNAIVLDGVTYGRGIGMHAPTSGVSTADWAINGAAVFKATIGINDYTTGSYGSVIFRVYVDNVLQYTSATLTSTTAPIDLAISTAGGTTLRLEIDNGGNGNVADHSVWANARFEGGTVGLAVAENATNGTIVGSVNRTDSDWGDNATYSLVDSAGDRFAISSTTGLITVANGSLLNFESSTSHSITVRATDAGGLTFDKVLTINVSNVNEAPVAVLDTATAIEAGGAANGSAGSNPTGNVLANDTDVDAGDTKTVSGVTTGTVGSASGSVATAVTGAYGSINIAANGAYTYTVDNSNATVQALRTSGQTITDVFTYTVTDSGGLMSTTQITVTIQGANDFPIPIFDTATAVEAGGVSNGTAGTNPTGNVLTNDTDVDSAGNGETKTVAGILAGTQASASGNVASSVTGSFGSITIAANGAYTYTVDNSNATVQALRTSGQTITDIFTYTMADTAGATSTTQITVTIHGNNDTPYDITSGVLTVDENVANGTAVGSVAGYDVDATETLSFSLVDSAGGRFAINSSGQITVADGSLLNFEAATTHTITVRVTDLAGAFYDENFNVSVNDVNEAPVLDNSGSPLLTTTTEDNVNNSGHTVATIIASAGGDRITDVDAGAVEGIAVTTLSSGNGTWQYSLDGTNWTDIGAVSNSSALLLRSTDHIRFVPNGQNATSADFTFRAWDQTSGSVGNKVDASINGGATAFSSNSEVASISVTAVNDAPTINDSATVSLTGTDEDTVSPTFTVTSLLSSVAWGDVDFGAVQGIVITGTSGQGVWQYFTGGSWTSFGSTSSISGLLLDSSTLIRYSPDSMNAETANFSFRAWDQTSGTASTSGTPQYVNSTINGGTTAFSSQSSNAQIVVTAINDAAIAVADTASGNEAGGYLNGTAGSNPSGNVLSNDSDVDAGDTFSVTGVAAGVVSSATGNVSSSVSGTYGTIQIAAHGSFVYSIDNSNSVVQALLNSGQSLTDTFTYTIQDTGGAYSSTQIVVTIVGANDAPIAGVDNAVAIEASGFSNGIAGTNPTGNVMINDIDVDNGDTKTVVGVLAGVQSSASSNVGTSVAGTYGAITINAAGVYSYVLDNNNALVQALRTSGDTLSDVFTYTMQDAAGLTSTTQITVTIQGANDGPQANNDSDLATEAGGIANGTSGTNPTGNVLNNDTDIDSGDSKTVSGVVAGSAASASGSVGVGLVGSYGTINLSADGSYTYTVDNNNSAVQALRQTANTLLELFTYTMSDAGGLTSTSTLTITIQGSNDNPIAVANTATAIEAGGISNGISGSDPTGNVLSNDADVDSGDTKTVVGVATGVQASASGSVGSSLSGTYGAIVINADGTYTYTLDNSNATVQALNTGQSLSETFTYTVQDSAGATSTSTVQITIDGADDLPFANVDFDVSEEAGGLNNSTAGTTPTGNVFVNDIHPNGSTLTGVEAGVQSSASGNVNAAVAGLYGTITITASGDYAYTLNNSLPAVEALRTSGDHLTDIFSYTFQDSLGYYATTQVTITINGKNDTPIAGVDNGVAIEAGGFNNTSVGTNATGSVLTNDTDIDSGDTRHVVGVIAGSAASASGNVGASINGSYGSIVVSDNGSYTYVVDENNSAVQALRTSGQTLLDLFTYTIEDTAGATSTATLSITIQGDNDNPLAVSDSFVAVESGGVSNGTAGTNPSGNVLTNDTDVDSVDNGEAKTVTGVAAGTQSSSSGNVASSVAGSYGSIQIASNGALTYTVDNNNAAVQALRTSGNTLTDVFTYTVTDTGGLTSTTQVSITIQGSNDTPTITSDTAAAIEAGGVANGTAGNNSTGNVLTNDSDVDAGDALTVSGVAAGIQASASGSIGSSVVGSYGSLNVNADGSYVYIVDNSNLSVQALRLHTDTLTDVFTYTAQDSAGATSTTQITLTIHGRNDAPVAFANNADAYESGGIANATLGNSASGNVISNDLEYDSGDTTTVSGVAAGNQASTSGSVGSSVVGSFGSITIQSDGSYSYSIDESNATVQALRLSSQTIDDIFSYTIVDAAGLSSTTQITVTIHGANDAPVAVADSDIATEAGGLNNATAGSDASGNVLSNDTDADSGDTKNVTGVAAGVQSSTSGSVGATVTGIYGSINISSTGAYLYSIDNSNAAVQALRNSGQTLQDIFSYTVVDNAGLSSTTQVTITIQGANDTPTAAADTTAIAIEAGGTANGTPGTNGTGNVLSNDVDVDSVSNGETQAVAGVAAGFLASTAGNVASSVGGSYGSITINADGSYTYVVDNSNSSVQALRTASDTLLDVFTYTMIDADGLTSTSQVTVTLQGSNDAPVGVGDSTTAIEAGGYANGLAGANGTGNVLANDTDVDSSDLKAVSGIVAGEQSTASGNVATAVAGLYGSITVQADGSYSYIVDNANISIQSLRSVVDTLTDYFTYEVTDTGGLSSLATITITITGSNDAPITVNDNASATEASGAANGTAGADPAGNVLTNDADVDSLDNGETISVSGVAVGVIGNTSGSVGTEVVGLYGSITIQSDGSYTYAIDNDNVAVQALRISGHTLDDVFSYTVTDAAGLTSTAQITVTIHGANDAPTAVTDTGTAIEAGGINNATAGGVGSGNVLTNDIDPDSAGHGETRTVVGVVSGVAGFASGNVATGIMGSYGSIVIQVDGSYTYTIDNNNASVQALRISTQTLVDVFTYSATDAGGLVSTTQITITLQGSNDTPTAVSDNGLAVEAGGLSNATGGSDATGNVLTNDVDVDSSANGEAKSVSGVAAGVAASASGSVGNPVNGSYGAITINADGSYSYSIDNSNSAVQALRTVADTLTDVFTYTMVDAAGLSSTTQVTITIQGQNDNPVALADSVNATEAGGIANGTVGSNATGNVLTNDSDVDSAGYGETRVVTGVSAGIVGSTTGSVAALTNGLYGSITLAANGTYNYVIDNTNSAVQALRTSSDTLEDVFTYTITDAGGLTSTTQLTVTLHGANDAPHDITAGVLVVAEASSNGTAVGSASGHDLDSGETFSYSLVEDAFGRFAINSSSGQITVSGGSSLDYEAQTFHLITVRVTDAAGSSFDKQFTVDLTDVNEFSVTTPVDINASANSINENAANGTLVGISVSSVDGDVTNSTVTYSIVDSAFGRFAIDANTGVVTVADGSQLDRETNSLHTITVRATSADGSTADTNFTINVLDVDEFNAVATTDIDAGVNTVSENSSNGTLVGITALSSDDDATNNTISYSLANSASGRFDIDSVTGVVSVANGAILNFEDASIHTIVVRATSSDGSFADQSMNIAISNVNEAPTLATATYATDSITPIQLTAPGLLALAADPENDPLNIQLITAPSSGSLVILSDGTLLYSPSLSFSGTVTFVAEVTDGAFAVQKTYSIVVTEALVPPPPPPPPPPPTPPAPPEDGSGSGDVESTNTDSGNTDNSGGAVAPPPSDSNSNGGVSNGNAPVATNEESRLVAGVLSESSNKMSPTSVSALADALDLLKSNRLNVHANFHFAEFGNSALTQRMITTSLQRLEDMQLISNEQKEIAVKQFHVNVDNVVVTALSTGVAIWAMYIGQVVITLLSTSATWIQVDPLVVLQGKATDDDTESLDAEERLFDHSR